MALMRIQMNPDAITCYVKTGETVTAGDFVKADASSNDVVTSAGASSFIADDLQISSCNASGDENFCIGIAATDGSAGDVITVFTRGLFIVKANGAITAGNLVQKEDSTDAQEVDVSAAINNNSEEQEIIGRALTSASAADAYLVILLNI